jgi:hypothetical protein
MALPVWTRKIGGIVRRVITKRSRWHRNGSRLLSLMSAQRVNSGTDGRPCDSSVALIRVRSLDSKAGFFLRARCGPDCGALQVATVSWQRYRKSCAQGGVTTFVRLWQAFSRQAASDKQQTALPRPGTHEIMRFFMNPNVVAIKTRQLVGEVADGHVQVELVAGRRPDEGHHA